MALIEEELSKHWENLNLTSEENSIYHAAQTQNYGIRGQHCIAGKILSEKGLNNEAFRKTMALIWKLKGWVRFKELGDQKFLIEFQHIADKEKVLSGRPWFFDRNLLTLQEIDEAAALNTIQFRYEPFWIQFHNMPLAAMNEDMGNQFGAGIGHVIRVDADSDGSAWGKCLRARIAINIHKPLLRGRWLEFEGKKYWIYFKYERLQSFCFHCGILFHQGTGCTRQRTDQRGDGEKIQQFGPWLRAQPLNTNIFDCRKYGGSVEKDQNKETNITEERSFKMEDIRLEEKKISTEQKNTKENQGKNKNPLVAEFWDSMDIEGKNYVPDVSNIPVEEKGKLRITVELEDKNKDGKESKMEIAENRTTKEHSSLTVDSNQPVINSHQEESVEFKTVKRELEGTKTKGNTWKRRTREANRKALLISENVNISQKKREGDSRREDMEHSKKQKTVEDMKLDGVDPRLVEAAVQLHQQQ